MSSRARLRQQALRGICFCLLLFASLAFASLCLAAHRRPLPLPSKAAERPRIFGIAGVTLYSSEIPDARKFYQELAEPNRFCEMCEDIPSRTLTLSNGQTITLDPTPRPDPHSLLKEITFRTDDLHKLEHFFKANQIHFQEEKDSRELACVTVTDPEGHGLAFVGAREPITPVTADSSSRQDANSGMRIIHAGFVVHDRAAEDHFYKDILGFHLYWHGGMKNDVTDWVDMQVPDGTDWIEYMLNIPADASHRLLGVMNHFALGVPDIHAAEQQLLKNGMKLTEQPKIGRDGKWQLNLYDPDDTRVELMEFTPVEKPCCSEFTGPHPGPKR
jgi:catechol 2,3-dioxygenase-like lactoylglutathione lyase family enzyme